MPRCSPGKRAAETLLTITNQKKQRIMATRKIECKGGARYMEYVYARLQEQYTHVEFLSYDGRYLVVAYIT